MKLIEKECPNCGAGLSFTPEDKNCKCEYCKREFEIVRDTDKAKSLADQFNLSELKAPLKTFSKIFGIYTIGSIITSIFIFLVFAVIMISIIFGIITAGNNKESISNQENIVTDEKDLTKRDLDTIDLNAKITIMKKDDDLGDYTLKGSPVGEKLYIISKDEENILIPVYKTTYQNFFETEHVYTIYVPVTFKDVKTKNNSIAFSLGKGVIDAPEYYFNLEHSDFAYGYQDLEALDTEIRNKYNDYNIVEEK